MHTGSTVPIRWRHQQRNWFPAYLPALCYIHKDPTWNRVNGIFGDHTNVCKPWSCYEQQHKHTAVRGAPSYFVKVVNTIYVMVAACSLFLYNIFLICDLLHPNLILKNKTNHPISSNSHPSATANKAIHCLKWGWMRLQFDQFSSFLTTGERFGSSSKRNVQRKCSILVDIELTYAN